MIAAGFPFVDAPVSGGVKRAANGTLAIMVGGDAATIDRIATLLSAMGTSIFRTGALGSGHAMKALNNYVSAAGLVAAVEALRIGRKFGLDPALMTDILNVVGQEQHHRSETQAVHHLESLPTAFRCG